MIRDELDGWLTRGFDWRDGARLVRFGLGAAEESLALLTAEKLRPFILLTTPRAAAVLPDLAAAAVAVAHVPAGPVPEAAAVVERQLADDGLVRVQEGPLTSAGTREVRLGPADRSASPALLAVGGGRVIDTAKALAAAHGLGCAAIPTTLSGAEMTPSHRPLPDGRGAVRNAPRLVVTDPVLLTQPYQDLAASAMNAFGHAMEALYMSGRSPVTSVAALEGARLLLEGLEAAEGERSALALGGLLAGYAIGSTGLGFHHALCQTVVRETGAPHAQVYAVLAPHSLRFMLPRAPEQLAPLASLLAGGAPAAAASARGGLQEAAIERLSSLAARSGVTGLAELGVPAARLPAIAAAARARAEVRSMRDAPTEDELVALLGQALQPTPMRLQALHVPERHLEVAADERSVARALGLDDATVERIDEGTSQSVDGTGTGTESEVEE